MCTSQLRVSLNESEFPVNMKLVCINPWTCRAFEGDCFRIEHDSDGKKMSNAAIVVGKKHAY